MKRNNFLEFKRLRIKQLIPNIINTIFDSYKLANYRFNIADVRFKSAIIDYYADEVLYWDLSDVANLPFEELVSVITKMIRFDLENLYLMTLPEVIEEFNSLVDKGIEKFSDKPKLYWIKLCEKLNCSFLGIDDTYIIFLCH